jgi:hypothetical protein
MDFSDFWLCGIIVGDGYFDDRHVDIYNSSASVLRKVVKALKTFGLPERRLRVDIYGDPNNQAVKTLEKKWKKILKLQNIKVIENNSPWKSNSEKLRIRIASKKLASFIRNAFEQFKRLNNKQKKNFIQGLFDAEASVDFKGYVEFKQKDCKKGKRIIQMIYKEINSLGISTTQLRIKKDKEKRNLYFCVKDLEKYNRVIGFSCEEKLGKLKRLIKIKKENRKVTENLLLEAIGREKKTLEELILQLQAPYHRIRRILINLSLEGKIDTQKIGNKNYYLATRQTRYP